MSVHKHTNRELSDQQCWQQCCEGKQEALFWLMERYRIQLFGMAYAMTKQENTAQEVLRQVFVQLHQKSVSKEKLKNIKKALIEITQDLSKQMMQQIAQQKIQAA
ncbi:hypothetical protein [uncultured Microscilla sp.]|uniref:RNA polymerase sigma factor n=1 Tax=uncultured Microscilla sp. TaxID=432653 RepID=UPI00262304F1|nr:hypothetical protein [uncultured Microscilla sp.]